jgi:hypothetical protein
MAIISSVNLKTSRYVHGGNTEVRNDKLEWWERRIFNSSPTDLEYVVENKYEGRLDLIAYAFYGDPKLWWIIGQYNNILDPITEIVPGRILTIPIKDRVMSEFLDRKLGGYESQRELEKIISPVIV